MPGDPYAYIVAAYQAPPSPDYMPGPEEPQSPPPLDFVPEPMYHEYITTVRNRSRFRINKWYQSLALINFDLEDMELESTNSSPTAKLPILKLVIENSDSWVPISHTTERNGIPVTKMSTPATAEEKTKKKNDVKARSLLLMALPNEHQLTFSQYPDANLCLRPLKQDLEMNKPEIETMSIDDLYNNFKIVEKKIKKTAGTSSGGQNLAFMSAPNSSSTNDASSQVNAASPSINTASPQVSTSSVCDNTVYAFMVENPNGSNVLHQDLEQIHEDDLEAMDLKWQLSLLSVRAKKYYQKTGKKIFINGNDIAGKNEVLFSEEVAVFKREVRIKQYEINTLKTEFEKLKQEKEAFDFKIEKFDKASKDLDQLLGSQITDKSKKGFGYSAVPPPHPLIYNRPNKLDLSYSGLKEFKPPEFRGHGPENSKKESNVVCDSDSSKENSDKSLVEEQVLQVKRSSVKGCESNTSKSVNEVEPKKNRENNDAPIIEDWVSDDKEEDEPNPKSKKKIVIPTATKKEFLKPVKPVKRSVRYAEMYRSKSPRGNQRNWNGQKSNQLGKDFVMYKKACYICGSFNHLHYNCNNHQRRGLTNRNNNNRVHTKNTHPNVLRNMSTKAVLLNTGLTPLNTVKPVYTAHLKSTVHYARPKTHFYKSAQSTIQRPFYKKPALTNRHFNHKINTVRPRVVNTARSYRTHVNTVRPRVINTVRPNRASVNAARANGFNAGNPQHDDTGFVDSGCSRHMTGNIAYFSDFKQFDGGYVAFGGGAYGGKITSKGTLKTDKLDFEDVYFVNELKFNLFSVSQMCDKKNYVLFTDSECLVLSPNFKLPDENQILLKIPRKDNMYSFDMKNIVPKESLTCLVAKATLDESMLWHRRLGHINLKNINKLVKDNLVRGLPTKRFENDQTCVACLKGKQHRASCKSKVLNPITKPLFMLHMDLFGLTFDETSEILKRFIKEIENLVDKKVKIIKSDNGTEFMNRVMDDFYREKGIKREYSVARTPQQNGVAERRNMTHIEDAKTMLANSKLPTTFWAEAVSTACYVQNRVLVVKPHNKTPYELFRGFKPALSFMRPFGCHVTILNTLDSLGKFDGKSDEGLFVGYSLSSKAFRVYNSRTKRVEGNLHIGFLENKPMIEGTGPKWLFDIDSLTQSMNYVPVTAGTMSNVSAGTSDENTQDCIFMPIWKDTSYFDLPAKNVDNGKPKTAKDAQKQVEDGLNNENAEQERFSNDSSSKDVNAIGQQVNTASLDINTGSIRLNIVGPSVSTAGLNEEDNSEDEPEVD
ncbi:putative ribonuclease H-like domain-containing protein [Tanacetum coccineum]